MDPMYADYMYSITCRGFLGTSGSITTGIVYGIRCFSRTNTYHYRLVKNMYQVFASLASYLYRFQYNVYMYQQR